MLSEVALFLCLCVAVPVLFMRAIQAVRAFNDAYPLWGRDPIYARLFRLDTILVTYGLVFIGSLGCLCWVVALWTFRIPGMGPPRGLTLEMIPIMLSGMAYSWPWIVIGIQNDVSQPPFQERNFALAEDQPDSFQPMEVTGIEIDSEGQVIVRWVKQDRLSLSPRGPVTLLLPVRGIRIPSFHQNGAWLHALNRLVVGYVRYVTKTVKIKELDLPVYRLVDGQENSCPVILVKTVYGDFAQREGSRKGQKYVALADLLVRWGYAVRMAEDTSHVAPTIKADQKFGRP